MTGRILDSVKTVTGCDRVYQWATMDANQHFRLWLVPWWKSGPLRGPRYLVDAVVDADGCTQEEADEVASRLRATLGRQIGTVV